MSDPMTDAKWEWAKSLFCPTCITDSDFKCDECSHSPLQDCGLDFLPLHYKHDINLIKPAYVENITTQDKDEEDIYLTKLIDDHWVYIEALLIAHGNGMDAKICEFHYKSAFRHGFKHALEWAEGK